MELPRDLLRTLVAAVDAGTLDGAAQALALTPSAVSQRIRALERQLGRVLLTRTRPVRATPDGTVLLRLGRQTDAGEAEIAQGVQDLLALGIIQPGEVIALGEGQIGLIEPFMLTDIGLEF